MIVAAAVKAQAGVLSICPVPFLKSVDVGWGCLSSAQGSCWAPSPAPALAHGCPPSRCRDWGRGERCCPEGFLEGVGTRCCRDRVSVVRKAPVQGECSGRHGFWSPLAGPLVILLAGFQEGRVHVLLLW